MCDAKIPSFAASCCDVICDLHEREEDDPASHPDSLRVEAKVWKAKCELFDPIITAIDCGSPEEEA